MNRFTLDNFPIKDKTVFLRVDYNVPLKNGKVADDSKIKASLPTIRFLLSKNCKIILATHLGEPKGKMVLELKTNILAKELKQLLPHENIEKLDDCIGKELREKVEAAKLQKIFLLENLRFYKEEELNDFTFAHSLASLAEVYVNDAFAVSHRNHASVASITNFLPAVSGFLMENEISQLNKAFSPLRPAVWLMGGAKLDKIDLINQALKKADYLLIGGALAFPFLKAKGIKIGMSKIDANHIPIAKKLLEKYSKKIILPVDFAAAEEFNMHAKIIIIPHNQIKNAQIALDIGPETIKLFERYLQSAKLIVWNGPLGYFEWAKFALGTKQIGRTLGRIEAIKIAGGGETAAAIHKFHLTHHFTHVSTGGGASLEFLAGKRLPGIDALQKNYKKWKNKV